MALVEGRLGQAGCLAGNEFTAADIMSVFSLTAMRLFQPLDLQPTATSWPTCSELEHGRPIVARWPRATGPDTDAHLMAPAPVRPNPSPAPPMARWPQCSFADQRYAP